MPEKRSWNRGWVDGIHLTSEKRDLSQQFSSGDCGMPWVFTSCISQPSPYLRPSVIFYSFHVSRFTGFVRRIFRDVRPPVLDWMSCWMYRGIAPSTFPWRRTKRHAVAYVAVTPHLLRITSRGKSQRPALRKAVRCVFLDSIQNAGRQGILTAAHGFALLCCSR